MPAIAIKRWIKRIVLVLVVISITILAIRIYDTQRGPKLELWHTFVPHEMRAAEIDKASWADYIKCYGETGTKYSGSSESLLFW